MLARDRRGRPGRPARPCTRPPGRDDEVFISATRRLNPTAVTSDLPPSAAIKSGQLERATSEYTGAFLAGFHLSEAPEFERWLEEERAGLARDYATALQQLARRAADRSDWAESVEWWRKLAAQDPLNARVATGLMEALVATGDRGGALQHARVHEVLLQQELAAPPIARCGARRRSGGSPRRYLPLPSRPPFEPPPSLRPSSQEPLPQLLPAAVTAPAPAPSAPAAAPGWWEAASAAPRPSPFGAGLRPGPRLRPDSSRDPPRRTARSRRSPCRAHPRLSRRQAGTWLRPGRPDRCGSTCARSPAGAPSR
jgi:hypothetical protein